MKNFDYFEPETKEEVFSLLRNYPKDEVIILTGGTDILPEMKGKTRFPQCLVNIKRLKDLNQILYVENDQILRIGALAKLGEVERHPLIRRKFAILASAAHSVGSVQIRNLATIGGNICRAAPSADTVPALLVLESRLRIASSTNERTIPMDKFFLGPGETVLKHGEILAEIIIPEVPKHSGGVYMKHSPRRAMDLAVVGVAAMVCLENNNGLCRDVKIALGAVAPTPVRAYKAESALKGNKLTKDLILEVSKSIPKEAKPISDLRASAKYREEMLVALTRRSLTQAFETARGN